MIPLAASVLFYAMSLPANAPLQWWGPLTIKQCRAIEEKTSETWCLRIDVPRKLKRP